MNSFLLVAVPLFILVGAVMDRGRVAERIFDFAESMVGGCRRPRTRQRCLLGDFLGRLRFLRGRHRLCRRHRDQGDGTPRFPKGYAVGMTLCTSTLASIIPPSIWL